MQYLSHLMSHFIDGSSHDLKKYHHREKLLLRTVVVMCKNFCLVIYCRYFAKPIAASHSVTSSFAPRAELPPTERTSVYFGARSCRRRRGLRCISRRGRASANRSRNAPLRRLRASRTARRSFRSGR